LRKAYRLAGLAKGLDKLNNFDIFSYALEPPWEFPHEDGKLMDRMEKSKTCKLTGFAKSGG